MKRKIILSTALLIVVGGGYLKLRDTNKENELISARTLKEDRLVGVYIEDGDDYTKIDQIPNSGYTFNSEKSYCKIGDKELDMTITYDMNTKTLSIAPVTSKGTKCYLYFDKETALKDTILANSKVNTGTPDFSRVATTDEGLYKAQDDWGDSYYFRGAVTNNWVKFAGFYWRIIRINGDGSIRLIYNGTSAKATGDSTMINSSQAFNSRYNRSEYVGYMYTMNKQHGNTTNSSIKEVLDGWYHNELLNYANQINTEGGFCGDRVSSNWSSQPNGEIYYEAYERLYDNKIPTLKCSNSLDLYTVSGSSEGNKALTNPIGLITADEVAMAGGVYDEINTSYYLNNNTDYWTMSPFYVESSTAHMFYVRSNGSLRNIWPDSELGVRPVINLKADATIKSGNGTSSTPYEV